MLPSCEASAVQKTWACGKRASSANNGALSSQPPMLLSLRRKILSFKSARNMQCDAGVWWSPLSGHAGCATNALGALHLLPTQAALWRITPATNGMSRRALRQAAGLKHPCKCTTYPCSLVALPLLLPVKSLLWHRTHPNRTVARGVISVADSLSR